MGCCDRDVIEFNAVKIEVDVPLLPFCGSRGAEIVENEFIIPYRIGPVKMNNGILQSDVFEFDLVFEKEPVCDVYVY